MDSERLFLPYFPINDYEEFSSCLWENETAVQQIILQKKGVSFIVPHEAKLRAENKRLTEDNAKLTEEQARQNETHENVLRIGMQKFAARYIEAHKNDLLAQKREIAEQNAKRAKAAIDAKIQEIGEQVKVNEDKLNAKVERLTEQVKVNEDKLRVEKEKNEMLNEKLEEAQNDDDEEEDTDESFDNDERVIWFEPEVDPKEIEEKMQYDSFDELSARVQELTIENKDNKDKLRIEREKNAMLSTLNESAYNGKHSCNSGAFDEKCTELFLKEDFSPPFIIENNNRTHEMDIKMTHRTLNYVVGVECKNKKTVSYQDIAKFQKDKLINKFKGAIFISACSIGKIVEEEDGFLIKKDELYIFSRNEGIIRCAIRAFIHFIENDDPNKDITDYVNAIMYIGREWVALKKSVMKVDKAFDWVLGVIGKSHPNGDLYLVPKSKIRGRTIYKKKA